MTKISFMRGRHATSHEIDLMRKLLQQYRRATKLFIDAIQSFVSTCLYHSKMHRRRHELAHKPRLPIMNYF